MRKKIKPYLFIAPQLVLFTVFFLIPLVWGILVSFCRWDFISTPEFLGLENYKSFLVDTDNYFFAKFWPALKNTLLYVVCSVPLLIAVPLLFAAALQSFRSKFGTFLQAVFYFPSLLSVATVMITWKWLLDRSMGIVNHVLDANIGWTTDQPWFWIAVVVISVWWGLGGNMVVFIAGIASIPKELYEASAIDGAGRLKQFFHITIPGLKNQLMYALIMTTISSFNIYGQPLMLATTTDLPDDKSTLMTLIQGTAWGTTSNAGMASAMALMLGVIIFIVSLFQFRFSGKGE